MPVRVFPVASSGKPNYSDTFEAPRATGPHGGIDIFAAEGTPVFAVDDGEWKQASNRLGGTVGKLLVADGTEYYYAHLSGYEGPSRNVKAGELVAYVGHTGNAATTPPHLHFGIYPPGHGVPPIDPYDALRASQGTALATSPPSSGKPATRAPRGTGNGLAMLVVLYLLSRRG